MKLDQLEVKPTKKPKRVGRGISAGQGKTCGRGTKGQKSRSGWSRRLGLEGGQNPLIRKLPKLPGFKSHRPKPQIIYSHQLNSFKTNQTVDAKTLAEAGLVESPYRPIKLIVGQAPVEVKLKLQLPRASKSAIDQIKKAGGQFEAVDQLRPPAKDKKTTGKKANKGDN